MQIFAITIAVVHRREILIKFSLANSLLNYLIISLEYFVKSNQGASSTLKQSERRNFTGIVFEN